MKIKDRDYPHPVLTFFNDDYKKCRFYQNITLEKDGEIIKLRVRSDLRSKTLKKLINEKKASYMLHIECIRSRFRKKYIFQENIKELEIDSSLVDDCVEVVLFVIANEKIEDFYSEEFNKYFENIHFEIDKGDILAVTNQQKINVNKNQIGVKKASSIFNFKISEKKDEMLSWEANDKFIDIKIYKDYFNEFKINIGSGAECILGSMFIAPVLTEILTEMKFDEEKYEDEYWAESLKSLLLRLNLDLNNEICISNVVNKILEEIVDKSIEYIKLEAK